jgi:ABC-type lipoprotein export system ATPase subunit
MVDRDSSKEVLDHLGLSKRLDHIPSKLSGGEQQRVSIARALINEPGVLLADEPTGNLDKKNGLKIMEILKELNEKGMTIIFVTHDKSLADWGNRILSMEDGQIVDDVLKSKR